MKSRLEKKVPSFGRARSSGWALPERCRAAIRTARRGSEESIKPRQPSYKISSRVRPGIRPADRIRVEDGALQCGQHQAVETILKTQTVKGVARGHAPRW